MPHLHPPEKIPIPYLPFYRHIPLLDSPLPVHPAPPRPRSLPKQPTPPLRPLVPTVPHLAHNGTCANLRYACIKPLANSTNGFIPYLCYNQNNRFITMLGITLRPFQTSALSFSINGHPTTNYALHHAQAPFAFNALLPPSHLAPSRNQILAYTVHGCGYRLKCPNYFETRRDNFNLCINTMRSAAQLNPFLRFYFVFVDRIIST